MPDLSPNGLFQLFIDIAMLPLRVIIAPIDYFLAQIPGLDAIPAALSAVSSYVGSIPGLLVSLTGINPVLWNAVIFVLLAYFGIVPLAGAIKKVLNWFRGS